MTPDVIYVIGKGGGEEGLGGWPDGDGLERLGWSARSNEVMTRVRVSN